MENKFPKNVRQIGNVSDTPKIYVEDYVDTFLNQICDKADKEQAGAFLVGEKRSNRRTGVSLYFWRDLHGIFR